ncbi:MAG: hypothetical protein HYU81_02860 [Candidatus Brennerbacteria bacterium]|nr:hypothetical protein [Candidatus Brennerbacteria bacterium]
MKTWIALTIAAAAVAIVVVGLSFRTAKRRERIFVAAGNGGTDLQEV